MSLDGAQVQQVAKLAQLALSAEEQERFSQELAGILALMDQLRELDVSQQPSLAASQRCPLRADQVQPSLPRAELLAAAPAHDEAFLLVPRVR